MTRSVRHLVLVGGFAAAVAAGPAIATLGVGADGGAPAIRACDSGESEDQFTGTCGPDLVPNSPAPGGSDDNESTSGGPVTVGGGSLGETSQDGLPSISGIPCTGGNSGKCIGLSESEAGQAPVEQPQTSISSSP